MSEVSLGYSIIGCLRVNHRRSIEDLKNVLPGSPTKMDIREALGELVQLGLVEVESGVYFLADIPKPHPNSDSHNRVLSYLSANGPVGMRKIAKDTGLHMHKCLGALMTLRSQGRVTNHRSEEGMIWEVS